LKPKVRKKELNGWYIHNWTFLGWLETGIKSINTTKPDAVEMLPGIMPRITATLCNETRIPIINGGLITLKEEVISCLGAGAIGISTTKEEIWYM